MTRFVFGLALASFLSVGPLTLVRAQSSSEVAAARGLFREGLQAARAGDWIAARGHFERSYAIAPRPNTLLNLAGARIQTGQLVAAAEDYRRFIAEAEGRARRLRPRAVAALTELEPRIAHVWISVDGLLAADAVTLDAEEIPRAALGIDLPVDPGEHTVAVVRGEREHAQETFTLEEGAERRLTVDATVSLAVVARTEAPAAAFEPDPTTEDEAGDDTGLIVGVIVSVAAVVALGVTIGVAVALDSAGPRQGSVGDGVLRFD